MTKAELGTKIGDINAYLKNIDYIISHSYSIEDDAANVVFNDVKEASKIVDEIYSEYVKYDEKK